MFSRIGIYLSTHFPLWSLYRNAFFQPLSRCAHPSQEYNVKKNSTGTFSFNTY